MRSSRALSSTVLASTLLLLFISHEVISLSISGSMISTKFSMVQSSSSLSATASATTSTTTSTATAAAERQNNKSSSTGMSSSKTAIPVTAQQRAGRHTAKTTVKRMHACGDDYQSALRIFYKAHPLLTPDASDLSTDASVGAGAGADVGAAATSFDSKSILSIVSILAKYEKAPIAFNILQRTIQQHHTGIVPSHYLITTYKAIMGILGGNYRKTKKGSDEESDSRQRRERILQYVHHDIPFHTNKPPPIDVYHIALCALGKCRQMDSILLLLHEMEGSRSSSNSTIDSTRSNIRTVQTYDGTTLKYSLPPPDRMAYLTALTGSTKCKTSHHSMEIMDLMKKRGVKPDKVVYNQVLSSLASTKSNDRCELARRVWDQMEEDCKGVYSENAYKSLLSIFSKESSWEDVKKVNDVMESRAGATNSAIATSIHGNDAKRQKNSSNTNMLTGNIIDKSSPDATLVPGYLKDLKLLEKVDAAKKPWYRVGRISVPTKAPASQHHDNITQARMEISFGVQTHRNPFLNGVTLVFYDAVSGEKLGFMLIRNELEKNQIDNKSNNTGTGILYSSILGMLVDENQRGKGLSKIFMGTWLKLCLDCNALPRSEKINKPLLALVLSNFGFVPVSQDKVDVEISPIKDLHKADGGDDLDALREKLGYDPKITVYSRKLSPGSGHFGEREMRTQQMVISRYPTDPQGKATAVKTSFDHAMINHLREGDLEQLERSRLDLAELVDKSWRGGEFQLHPNLDHASLRRALFGYLYYER
eukprot:CAMPEP_0194109780 /NCGR_PEP_ID=MMETSP0150-20130528/9201_1 /TAXON_ID=122233 /ORGANISM="Chaetoceros debilis, Strain MM31A-1" /LENGTH=762 /DNA_ID=CAMNT_0038798819 /DNA_START=158 /DNA_END=2446 /DNA_ORIENTATION=+